MIRVAVTGAAGRMGQMIVRIISETPGVILSGAVEYPGHAAIGKDAGDLAGVGSLGVLITAGLGTAISGCDVVIDFTSAKASLDHLDLVASQGKAIVVGSTGFTPEEKAAINARKDAKIFFAPNMSVGMNLLFKLVYDAAKILGDEYDVEIIETHHRFKKDSPSGSAIRLAESVADALDRNAASDVVHGREGLVGERTRKEIGMHAVRAGDVVGDHTVVFGALGERLELTHKASSRETFARGAVRASLWISDKAPGVYDMMDVLGLK